MQVMKKQLSGGKNMTYYKTDSALTEELRIIGPFDQLIPLREVPLKGALADENLEVLTDAGLVVADGKIVKVGSFDELIREFPNALVEEMQGEERKRSVVPGFVDAHTHICFAGNRARDYALRVAGKPYLEIAKAGGGIWDSVTQTRAASLAELTALTLERANRLLAAGTTTIEVKSGYGLNTESELNMLRAIRAADQRTAADLVPTCLAAHMKPGDFAGSEREYLEQVVRELWPLIREERLSGRMDIFVEDSAFDAQDSRWYLEQAKEWGFELTVHADQFSTDGSVLAVAVGARSADHLEASTDREISLLAGSDTVAVVLPGASLGLGMQFSPARKLLDAGACVAIASDWNPGSAPMGDLLTQAAILGAFEKLSLSETLAGLSFRAAAALGLGDRGQLTTGFLADFQAYPTPDYRDIFYNQGTIKADQVWKNGKSVRG